MSAPPLLCKPCGVAYVPLLGRRCSRVSTTLAGSCWNGCRSCTDTCPLDCWSGSRPSHSDPLPMCVTCSSSVPLHCFGLTVCECAFQRGRDDLETLMASPLVRQFDEHSRSIHATLMFVCVWLCLCGCVCVAVCGAINVHHALCIDGRPYQPSGP